MGEWARPIGQYVKDNQSWLVPLASAGGAALSTPSAGGTGPILGNALSTGAGTYEQMQQIQATRDAAAARQNQLQQYRQDQLGVRRDTSDLRERALTTPRPLTQSDIDLKAAQAKHYGQLPASHTDPAANFRERRVGAAQREIQGAYNSYVKRTGVPGAALDTGAWSSTPEGSAVIMAAIRRHQLTPDDLGMDEGSATPVRPPPSQPSPAAGPEAPDPNDPAGILKRAH